MCEAKSNLKRKLENEKEVENKGFNIDGNMAKFLEHLDHHTKDLFQRDAYYIVPKTGA